MIRLEVAATKGLMGRHAQIALVWKHHLGLAETKKKSRGNVVGQKVVNGTEGQKHLDYIEDTNFGTLFVVFFHSTEYKQNVIYFLLLL